jgi:hypothetical protein
MGNKSKELQPRTRTLASLQISEPGTPDPLKIDNRPQALAFLVTGLDKFIQTDANAQPKFGGVR